MQGEKLQKWKQFMVAISANLAGALAGICMLWSSPSTAKLTQDDSPLGRPINSDELGWITSLLSLGAVFGPFFVWLLLDRIGRKWSLLISAILYLISNFLLIFIIKLWSIYVARFIQGLTLGMIMAILPVYNAEIATDDLRGAISCIMQSLMCVPGFYVTIPGSSDSVSYSLLQWICLPAGILFPITFIFMPDTPHYHISKRNHNKAIDSLKFLRGQSENYVLEEYEKIKLSVEKSLENRGSFVDLFKRRENLKAIMISTILIMFQQMMGSTVIYFNAQTIILESNTIDPVTFFIALNVLQFVLGIITLFTVDKVGRKSSLLFSSVIMALAMIAFGVYFYIQKTSENIETYMWLPTTCAIVYIFGFIIGFSPMPWVLVGELFSSDVKSFASSLTVCVCWLTSFIMTKLYPILKVAFGLDVVMWIYAFFAVLAFYFILKFVIETKGLSLQEIQSKLSGT